MARHVGLSDEVLTISHIPVQAITGTAVNGTGIDMSGWDGVKFDIPHGIFGTNGTLNALVQTDDNSGFNSPTNVNGTSLTQITNANGLAIIEVYRPSERYVRLQLTGQANGVTAGVLATRFRATGILPPTQTAVQVLKVASN